jgi:threonine/homoserine/homoserine lactone efflux protein
MATILTFLAILLPLSLSPGPVVIVLAGLTMGRGLTAAVPFWIGMQIAVMTVAIASALGLSQLFVTYPAAYNAVRYAGIAYIFWLARKFVTAKPKPGAEYQGDTPGVVPGILATLLNPKFYIMVMSVFSQFLKPGETGTWQLVAGFWVVMVSSAFCWMLAGALLRPLLRSERALRIQSATFGVALFAVAAWMALK